MKNLPTKNILLMVAGVMLLAISVIADRYLDLNDSASGFAKGIAIGLLFIALIALLKQKKHKASVKNAE